MSDRRVSPALSLATAAVVALALLPMTASAGLKDTVAFDVPAQQLPSALNRYSEQAGVQVTSPGQLIEGKTSSGITGRLEAKEALSRLLKDTQLRYDVIDQKTVVIMPAAREASAGNAESGRAGYEDVLRVVQTDTKGAQSPTGQNSNDVDQGGGLEEIVVTAQKRIERLQDVPVPVTAVDAESLVNSNQLRLQDYYTRIPGLSVVLADGAGNAPQLTIRGLATGSFTNPTVGIVVDDVPYGSSISQAGGLVAPDIDPSDLSRVEVLRGPQGTLYGANSMGGLLKFVTIDPSTNGVSGRIQAGVNTVYHGNETGYHVRGSINVPLSKTWAVLASAYTRREPGYIDDPVLGIEGLNRRDSDGGRLSALWQPSQDVSLKLSALLQDSERFGSDNAFQLPGFGDLQQSALRGTGGYERKSQVYSATLQAKLGPASLASVSGYSIDRSFNSSDISAFAAFLPPLFGVGTGLSIPSQFKTSKFTQELRLSAPIGERLEWLAGVFYTHEDSPSHQDILAIDPATAGQLGVWENADYASTFAEYAVFADLTFRITERFDIQVGGRESQNRQTYSSIFTGPYADLALGGSPAITDEIHSKDHSFTYLVTPRLKLSQDLMAYVRLASGYRAGGVNAQCTPLSAAGLDVCQYDADTTQNYEVGIKGTALNRALSFDASLYYIDWKDIQLSLLNLQLFLGYVDNASRAKSQGVELSVESRPLAGLTMSAWAAWNDATLTDDFPANSSVLGGSGDRLPYSSRFSGNFSLEQEFSITGNVTGLVGGAVSYQSERKGPFASIASLSPERQSLPAYATTDVHVGLRFDTWTANIFVNNVTDKRAILSGGIGTNLPFAFNYIQPRTAGLSLAKSF
jgi:outer membrane receptor protein involved in Fe transport